MELGIHIGAFPRPTLAAALDAVQAHGLTLVHFNFKSAALPSMPPRIGEGLCREIVAALRARHLRIATLSGTFNMIHPDRAVRRRGLERLEVLAAAAARLETSVITLCTGTRDPLDMWRGHPDNNTSPAWRDLTESMTQALRIADAHDVTLAVEPEVSNVVDSALKARRLLDELGSPRLKIVIDAANLFHAGELARMGQVLEQAFHLLGAELVAAHAKDLDRDGQAGQLAAGKGLLDYDHYLALLREVGFTGPLILHGLAEADVAASLAMLRGKLP